MHWRLTHDSSMTKAMSIIAQSNDEHHARFVLPGTGASGLKQPTLPMDPEHRPFAACEAEWVRLAMGFSAFARGYAGLRQGLWHENRW